MSPLKSKKDVMIFYDQEFLEKGLENMTEDIADYLAFEELYLRDALENLRYTSGEQPVLVDMGCGNGRILRLAKDFCGEFYGIDNAKKQARLASENVPEAHVIRADATKLPLKEGYADCATCMYNTLGNMPEDADKLAVLKEMTRALKTDGLGIVSVYARNARHAQEKFYGSLGLEIENETEEAFSLKEGLHSGRFTTDMLEELFRAAGLRYEKITEVKTKNTEVITEETTIAYICDVRKI